MAGSRNRLKFTPGGGEAEGWFAINALVVALMIRWTAVALAARAMSIPIYMLITKSLQ
jgi:hypothetical protein